jgi:acetyl-CoA carboxylase alpha subunit
MLIEILNRLQTLSPSERKAKRYEKCRNMGVFLEQGY